MKEIEEMSALEWLIFPFKNAMRGAWEIIKYIALLMYDVIYNLVAAWYRLFFEDR